MILPLAKVAEVLDFRGPVSDRVVKGCAIDSRRIGPDQLFFAIRGPRNDGHDFVTSVLDRGASGAVVEAGFRKKLPAPLQPQLVPVADTTEALQALARYVRRQWGGRIIAVTGSMGKTTTKEMIAALLATRFRVHKSQGNLNNHYGLPLALLGLESSHEVAVVELAMSAAGEIARLARIAGPDMGVVTNVAPVHLEFFDSVDAIAGAKRELIENLDHGNGKPTAILNFDDSRVRKFAEGFDGKVVTFGLSEGALYRGTNVRPGEGGSRFHLSGPQVEREFTVPLPGAHNVENALAALATAIDCGADPERLVPALAAFRNLAQRTEILTLPGGITVLNDCYNSNPRAMERMIETLAAWAEAKRRIVVAGEMLELGPTSPEWHRRIGRKVVECRIDGLVAVQGDARFIREGALEAGMEPSKAVFFPNAPEAARYCGSLLEPGDVVLVKGSRGVNLERVTELLAKSITHPSGASHEVPERMV
ncbi:MAG TPA: UDP-N-acetylmuramoyl-tripeptide--D-alanyl-D-alanine ligase [Terriglobia bacterium]|nr:UDP-N-acetylmuramoyl-tripeptide--D-alanyl-D-alanine ligase [Terriglobia bacterium]